MKYLWPLLLLIGTLDCQASISATNELGLQSIARNLAYPVELVAPAQDARLFILEQAGQIRIVKEGKLLAKPFLDLGQKVLSGGERGLLGLAFHPQYKENGRFFVHYSDARGDTQISQFRVSANPDLAEASSEVSILQVKQPYANHNGGKIAFGADDFLYISLGDGGSAGDPHANSQNLKVLLGKILRLDVDTQKPYAIPEDNPFHDNPNARAEIWAYGLRNAWKFTFDRQTHEMWIADVGQNAWEEIDLGIGAGNYGWDLVEGDAHCFPDVDEHCAPANLLRPIFEYSHGEGYSITGGYVYRGKALPEKYQGAYFFADYTMGWTRSFRYVNKQIRDYVDHTPSFGRHLVSSFGEDAQGELYLVDHTNGEIFKIVPAER